MLPIAHPAGVYEAQAVAGVLALLVCTTHLHYTQNMMENNYILLLTLAGFAFQYEWLITGERRALVIGSAAFGLNLLTRLTTGMDLIVGALFLLLVFWLEGQSAAEIWKRFRTYAATALPIYAVFLLIDRLYQYYRFGSFFNTYVSVFAQQAREMNPSLPANYPFEVPFHVGFFGALFAPEKSIFLFDPLLILTVLVVVRRLEEVRARDQGLLISSTLLLFIYISFYARYTVWSGDSAWGDRYVSSAAQMVAFLSVPLLLRYRAELGRAVWRVGMALIAIAAAVQVASVMFWLSLELYQMTTLGHPTFVVWLRFKNIVAFRAQQARGVGSHERRHADRSLGLRSHHHLEFPAIRVAPGGRGARMGRAPCIRCVDDVAGGNRLGLMAFEERACGGICCGRPYFVFWYENRYSVTSGSRATTSTVGSPACKPDATTAGNLSLVRRKPPGLSMADTFARARDCSNSP